VGGKTLLARLYRNSDTFFKQVVELIDQYGARLAQQVSLTYLMLSLCENRDNSMKYFLE